MVTVTYRLGFLFVFRLVCLTLYGAMRICCAASATRQRLSFFLSADCAQSVHAKWSAVNSGVGPGVREMTVPWHLPVTAWYLQVTCN
jgi:hypothetical protein